MQISAYKISIYLLLTSVSFPPAWDLHAQRIDVRAALVWQVEQSNEKKNKEIEPAMK